MGADTSADNAPSEPPKGLFHRLREGLDDVMPLLFVGVAAFILAYLSFRGNLSPLPGHYPIWILFSLVGVVATSGSLIAAALPDHEPLGDVVTIPRAEWEELVALQAARAPPRVPRVLPVPEKRPPVEPAPTVPPVAATGEPTIDGLLAELERIAIEVGPPTSPSSASPPPSRTPPVSPAASPEPPPAPPVPVAISPAPPPAPRVPPPASATSSQPLAAAAVPASVPDRTAARAESMMYPPLARSPFLEAGLPPSPTYCRGCGKRRRRSELVGQCGDCGEPICRTCVETGRRREGVLLCSACSDLQDAVDGKLPRDTGE